MRNGRCRLHGGLSTGPRTPEGLEALRLARTRHGFYSQRAIEQLRLNKTRVRHLYRLEGLQLRAAQAAVWTCRLEQGRPLLNAPLTNLPGSGTLP